jgi:hypothetical protein
MLDVVLKISNRLRGGEKPVFRSPREITAYGKSEWLYEGLRK